MADAAYPLGMGEGCGDLGVGELAARVHLLVTATQWLVHDVTILSKQPLHFLFLT